MDALKTFQLNVQKTPAKMGVPVPKPKRKGLSAVVQLALLVNDAKTILMGAKAEMNVVHLKTNVENGMVIVILTLIVKTI